ncbi:hypothetical protein GOBAR_AA02060 [Gossypium barbadense]|uniref:RNase H type-1 domain-containing protein n=1 Tax=Gossypium barbadense TaxID=3634 RepID=A0A2P5YSH1_GOSBA|nr:hypothetical protein GOBAR_AA02060 [Gossypium barbadense]
MASANYRKCQNEVETREHVIWTSRNRFIHEGEEQTGSQMADFITNYIKELDGLSMCLPMNRLHSSRWVELTDPWVRINFDAAFNKEKNDSSSGLLIRNARAEVICSNSVFHENIPSAFVAKAMACLQVVHLELFLGLREVEIEGDSRSVIQKLEANKVAHFIAKDGLQKRESTYLLGMVTSGVVEAMVVDRRWIDSVGD